MKTFQYQQRAGPLFTPAAPTGDTDGTKMPGQVVVPEAFVLNRPNATLDITIFGTAVVLPPSPDPGVAPLNVPYKIPHTPNDADNRVRKPLQIISNIGNSLLENGELRGASHESVLGYRPGNVVDWGAPVPYTVREAFDRLAAIKGELNSITPLLSTASTADIINKINEILDALGN